MRAIKDGYRMTRLEIQAVIKMLKNYYNDIQSCSQEISEINGILTDGFETYQNEDLFAASYVSKLLYKEIVKLENKLENVI